MKRKEIEQKIAMGLDEMAPDIWNQLEGQINLSPKTVPPVQPVKPKKRFRLSWMTMPATAMLLLLLINMWDTTMVDTKEAPEPVQEVSVVEQTEDVAFQEELDGTKELDAVIDSVEKGTEQTIIEEKMEEKTDENPAETDRKEPNGKTDNEKKAFRKPAYVVEQSVTRLEQSLDNEVSMARFEQSIQNDRNGATLEQGIIEETMNMRLEDE